MREKKRFFIIDSNSVIHRAYHALPHLTTKKGELVNAVYGFLLIFFKIIKEFQPDYIATCFDFPGPTFRHKKFREYKAKRPPAPEELYDQIPKVKEVLNAFDVPIFEKEGFEADDIIGTISHKSPQKQIFPEIETIILSGDLDTLQLVNKNTKVYLLRRGVKDTVLYDEKRVQEKYRGLGPNQLVDLKALKGDPSDNIPGIVGIGEKTAVKLLEKFGSIEKFYSSINQKNKVEIKQNLLNLLKNSKEEVLFNKTLAKIREDVPIDFDIGKCRFKGFDQKKVEKILKDYEFYSLLKRTSRENITSENRTLF